MSYFSQIPEHPNYFISEEGKVVNVTRGRYLKPAKTNQGYLFVLLGRGNPKYIHRLVASAWLAKDRNRIEVNHKDGNKENNHYSNLEWCTRSENNQHALDTGLRKSPMIGRSGAKHPTSNPVVQVKDGNVVKIWDCAKDAVNEGFRASSISSCCNGKLSSHAGYAWRFA